MNTFVNSVRSQRTTTTNGMSAYKATGNNCTTLFYKIGASRGKNIIPEFVAAYAEDREIALRIAQWARDARGGSGERKLFRDILVHLSQRDPDAAVALVYKTPEIGRWDDLLIDFGNDVVKFTAFAVIRDALAAKNGLCAKWMPRKGPKAAELRSFLGWSPKRYRKTLVELTKVVETDMCARKWDTIEFSHVPSLAMSRYRKAFERHTPAFSAYTQKLASGDKSVKINAGAVYPYDVLKQYIPSGGYYYGSRKPSLTERQAIVAQWNALPNFVGDANILPMVDVSGSMTCKAGSYQSKSDITCLQVAVSLGLYLADKNTGAFKDTFLTFTGDPQLLHLKGDIVDKIDQMASSTWQMNTNFVRALKKILQVAKDGNVPRDEMPKVLLVLSDMQFDAADRRGNTATDEVRRLYIAAGYDVPNIVYWNLNAYDNVPVKYDTRGTALVSGFSPTIVKAVLATDLDNMTPEAVMLKAIMVPRYDLVDTEA